MYAYVYACTCVCVTACMQCVCVCVCVCMCAYICVCGCVGEWELWNLLLFSLQKKLQINKLKNQERIHTDKAVLLSESMVECLYTYHNPWPISLVKNFWNSHHTGILYTNYHCYSIYIKLSTVSFKYMNIWKQKKSHIHKVHLSLIHIWRCRRWP